MMSNNGSTHSDEFKIDDTMIDKRLINETNGSNNNFTDTITKSVEKIVDCDDYSSIEDLLNIDNFITQTENKNDGDQCSGYHTLDTNLLNTNSGIHSINPSSLKVDLTFAIEEAIAPGNDNIHSRNEYITDHNKSTVSNVNFMPTNENLMTMAVTDVDSQSSGPSTNLGNDNSNTTPISDHIVQAEKIDTPTVPVAKSTKTSKAQNKHFPQFIKLYCEKCGESPWNSRYYTNPKCPTCENKASLRCSKCKQEADKYENIVYHLKTKCAPNNVRYKCSQCDYNTYVRASFKQHIKTHEPPKNIKCSDCGISILKCKKSLGNHKRYHCPNRQQAHDFECSSCCKGYKYEKHLRKHEKNCFYAQGRAKKRLAQSSLPVSE